MEKQGTAEKPKRRPRYKGTHPRHFQEKYKELNPEKYAEEVQKVMASGKTPAGMHRPIMVEEILAVLEPKAGEVAVDCTLGYGGHAVEILRRIQPGGKLIGLDQDPVELPKTEARMRAMGFGEEEFVVGHSNFAGLPKVLGELGLNGVDMVLADLGISSMQLDNPERGFSYKVDGPLDLRMNPNKGISAGEFLKRTSEAKLEELLRENSDEPHAELLAREICGRAGAVPVVTTRALAEMIKEALQELPRTVREREGDGPIRRTFQALRIAVNDEFGALDTLLRVLPQCLNLGGRAAILTFHSGEDRRVKKAFQHGLRDGVYARISDDVIRPSAEEMRANPRSSSAKLRWAIRG